MEYLVELQNVTKSYGVVDALGDVSFGIRPGEVHALLGENGAGKSTAIHIIKGEISPTQGTVLVDGKTVQDFGPQASERNGFSIVHQELAIFNGLSVTENLFPASPMRSAGGFVKRNEQRTRAREMLSLFKLAVDPDQRMDELTSGQKQIVEILRAVARDSRLVILDEPTSSLNADDTRTFLDLVAELRAKGRSVLFVSHRIPEVLEISDRVTVLRDGRFVETVDNDGLTEQDLVRRMVGRDLTIELRKPHPSNRHGATLIEVKDLSDHTRLNNISFRLDAGQVVGVFGLEGSGTSILSKLIFGLQAAKSGTITVAGSVVSKPSPLGLIKAGVTFLCPNRSEAGLFLERPIADSITAPVLRLMSRLGFVQNSRINETAEKFKLRFAIKTPSTQVPPLSLSGGNQQKVMMAACLTPEPKVVIVNDPTRGVDVGAKAEMHKSLHKLADDGSGVLVFSSDLPELLTLCDRVMVLRQGALAGTVSGEQMTEENIMALAATSSRAA